MSLRENETNIYEFKDLIQKFIFAIFELPKILFFTRDHNTPRQANYGLYSCVVVVAGSRVFGKPTLLISFFFQILPSSPLSFFISLFIYILEFFIASYLFFFSPFNNQQLKKCHFHCTNKYNARKGKLSFYQNHFKTLLVFPLFSSLFPCADQLCYYPSPIILLFPDQPCLVFIYLCFLHSILCSTLSQNLPLHTNFRTSSSVLILLFQCSRIIAMLTYLIYSYLILFPIDVNFNLHNKPIFCIH